MLSHFTLIFGAGFAITEILECEHFAVSYDWIGLPTEDLAQG